MWSAITTVEELAQLLRDLDQYGIHPERGPSFANRIERGRAQVRGLRRVLDESEVIDLNPAEPATSGPGDGSE